MEDVKRSDCFATVQSLREQLSALRLKYGNYGGPMGELFDLAYKMAHALNAAHSTVARTDLVQVSRSFLETTPCPNRCEDGMIVSRGPDPVFEPCQWCEAKSRFLAGELPIAPSAREGQHWVSVSERLPDGDGPVIAYVGVETPAICFYDGHWYYWDSSGTSADVTHWMPVPKRPSSSTRSDK